jgi:hypothetical protein
MSSELKDNTLTIAALGLLAYASADIAHHVFGHGAACLLLGGRVISLSSVFVNCSLRGSAIDLAGPLANLVVGLLALLTLRIAKRASSETRLVCMLAAAFNLLWFSMQLAYSAATRVDDWAWAMHQWHVSEPVRYALIVSGALGYLLTVRVTAARLVPFAHPQSRARNIVLTSWLTAGAIACATAAFAPHAWATIVQSAAPQSLLLSIGLLFVPARAGKLPSTGAVAAPIRFAASWTAAAALVGLASIVLLGPGFALPFK